MKTFRIYYKNLGVTYKRTPVETIKAADAEKAIAAFNACHRGAIIVAVFG